MNPNAGKVKVRPQLEAMVVLLAQSEIASLIPRLRFANFTPRKAIRILALAPLGTASIGCLQRRDWSSGHKAEFDGALLSLG